MTPESRVLTGLALVVMGGLLWLAFQEHVWARPRPGPWPLFILIAGFCAVLIVTDRDRVVGKIGIVAGVSLLLMARLGLVPELELRTLGPWAVALAGAAIALSGFWLRGRPIDERTEADAQGAARGCEQPLQRAFARDTSGRHQAKAS